MKGLRWSDNQEYIYYSDDWSEVYNLDSNIIKYKPFNPDTVIDEINKVGIDEYNGQVFYFIPKSRDIYPLCRFDAVLNDAQFEDEATIGRLRGMQNDYPLGGLMKLPLNLYDDEEYSDILDRIKTNAKGQKNASSWIAIPVHNEEFAKAKFFEPNTRQNVDRLTENQENRAEKNIYKTYQQPPILNGVSNDGMFNQDQFSQAFDCYNSKTQNERTYLEKFFNKFWKYTVWYNNEKLSIIPNEYIIKRNITNDTTNEGESTESKGDK